MFEEYEHHKASVTVVGDSLFLACGSMDGTISIIEIDKEMHSKVVCFRSHPIGCGAVAWMPIAEKSVAGGQKEDLVLASGGCDSLIRFWRAC